MKILGLGILYFLILVAVPLSAQKIKIETKDRVTIVRNPKKPVKVPGAPKSLTLIEDLCIGEPTSEEDYVFADIRAVQVDDEEDIIVLDWKENVIKVFNKNGKHLRTFGKTGQGPGEFQNPSRMYLRAGTDITLMDTRNNRMSYYSKKGECLKEIQMGKNRVFRTIPDSRGYIYGDMMNIEKKLQMELI